MITKKIYATLLALITCTTFHSSIVHAKEQTPVDPQYIQMDEHTNFTQVSGIISKINKEAGTSTLIVENEEKTHETHFPISDEVLIYNSSSTNQIEKSSLIEGSHVDVYYDKHKPILMIYPAKIHPEIVIVHDKKEAGKVKISKFDQSFVSLDQQLQLTISDETILLNQKHENITKEELNGKELLVFYTVSTKSIPAQTNPTKIIALNIEEERLAEELQYLLNEDAYIINHTKMIPIRKAAEYLGYDVKWQPENSTVLITNNTQSFQIVLGNETYESNHTKYNFKEAPTIRNGTMYVSEEMIKNLLAN